MSRMVSVLVDAVAQTGVQLGVPAAHHWQV